MHREMLFLIRNKVKTSALAPLSVPKSPVSNSCVLFSIHFERSATSFARLYNEDALSSLQPSFQIGGWTYTGATLLHRYRCAQVQVQVSQDTGTGVHRYRYRGTKIQVHVSTDTGTGVPRYRYR